MSLLLDQNLSRKLVSRLAIPYPGCTHVLDCGLQTASDADVWAYAQRHALSIVTKDSDFIGLLALRGHPPKVLWLQSGNGPSSFIEGLLLAHQSQIATFLADPSAGLLVIR